jgi:hypothetical protein
MLPEFRIIGKIGESVHECTCGDPKCAEDFKKEFFAGVMFLSLDDKPLSPFQEFGPFETRQKAEDFLNFFERQIRGKKVPGLKDLEVCKPESLH